MSILTVNLHPVLCFILYVVVLCWNPPSFMLLFSLYLCCLLKLHCYLILLDVSWLQSEEERLRDQREREELERHIRERDAAGTRKVNIDELALFG